MTPRRQPVSRPLAMLAAWVLAAAALGPLALHAHAQAGAGGIGWQELSPAQRGALAPLERDWAQIAPDQKRKWAELAERLPRFTPDERSRVQARMAEWARMTPQERGRARINFQEAKVVSPQERQAQWEAYQALTPEQRQQLAARAAPAGAAAAHPPALLLPHIQPGANADETPAAKTNIVPNPAHAQPPRQVAPTVVQAQPGATTTLITKRPVPPPHQQTGVPKIAATPEFVDSATLLPRRGPQAAATRAAAASDPQAPARR